MKYEILTGDNRQTLKTIPDDSIDAIVTDPPYGIDFLGKAWDANTGALETYQECLRVLKPGGHILAFSAARTYHHLAVTLEQAGFEIRDQIMWIYSSGFPKSQDVGRQIQRSLGVKEIKMGNPNRRIKKNDMPNTYDHGGLKEEITGDVVCTDPEAQKWAGWGTQLKPAHEPICLARKPIKLSIAKNCQQWGVGALNIDAIRIPYDDPAEVEADARWRAKWSKHNVAGPVFQDQDIAEVRKKQNKPAGGGNNAATFKNFSAEERTTKDQPKAGRRTASFHNATGGGKTQSGGDGSGGWEASNIGRFPSNVIGEIPDYQKYFYCPKVSRRERHIGFDEDTTLNKQQWLDLVGGKWCNEDGSMGEASKDGAKMCWIPGKGKIFVHGLRHEVEEILKLQGREAEIPQGKGNNHPTVKPIELMKYLIKLITPPGGTVLDPFTGSGSTGCAAVELGHPFVGCELDPNYVEIAQRRIGAWYGATRSNTQFEALFE
jgi:site-specific DNA-methyltransferase (adenine-specific)